MSEFCGIVLCFLSWITCQLSDFRREVEAQRKLEADHEAIVNSFFIDGWPVDEVSLDLREMLRGRLYTPVVMVYIDEAALDRVDWDHLRSFRYLESLTLRKCRLEPGMGADFSTFHHLEWLHVNGTVLTIYDIRTLTGLSRLRTLDLFDAGVRDDWMKHITELRRLRSLNIQGDVSDAGIEALDALTKLHRLFLPRTQITSKSAATIARLRRLRDLSLSHTRIDDKFLEQLSTLPDLRYLYLTGTNISDRGLMHLATLDSLEGLFLEDTAVTDTGLRHLGRLPRLQRLDLSGTRVSKAAICILREFPSLKSVRAANTKIEGPESEYVDLKDRSQWTPPQKP